MEAPIVILIKAIGASMTIAGKESPHKDSICKVSKPK